MPEIRQSEKVGTVGIKFVFRFRFSVKQVASQVASLDIGYKAGVAEVRNSKPKVLFLLGADEETVTRSDLPKNSFVVYIGNNSKGSFPLSDCDCDVATMGCMVLNGIIHTEVCDCDCDVAN